MIGNRGTVALAAGACLSCALGGACAALTAVPPLVMIACAAILAALAVGPMPAARGPTRGRASLTCLLSGIALGLALPKDVAPPDGRVYARALSSSLRGDLFEALDRLDRDPGALVHRRIAVSGAWTPAHDGMLATVSRRVMTCCAADALDVGFDIASSPASLPQGSWVRATGVVERTMRDGELRYVLEQCSITRLEERP